MQIGNTSIGAGKPIVVQSMCTTHTRNAEETASQVAELSKAGAGIVRIAVDNKRDAQALEEIRDRCDANLTVDLQENYRLAAVVAKHVDRYAITPATFITTSGKNRFWRKCSFWQMLPVKTTVRCGSA